MYARLASRIVDRFAERTRSTQPNELCSNFGDMVDAGAARIGMVMVGGDEPMSDDADLRRGNAVGWALWGLGCEGRGHQRCQQEHWSDSSIRKPSAM